MRLEANVVARVGALWVTVFLFQVSVVPHFRVAGYIIDLPPDVEPALEYVKNNNLSFREAYKISAKLVNYAEKNKKKLNQLNFNELKKIKNNLNKKVMHVLDVRNSVNLKTSYGGTSTKNIKKMVSKLKREFK
mgnify:CR=1 FL=1